MTDYYMDLKPDFEKSVINFKWQECCHCPPGVNCISGSLAGILPLPN